MINGVKRRWTLAAAALALGVCAVGVGSLAIDSKVNASAPSDSMRSDSVSPIPTRMPLVNGILSSPAAAIVSRRRAGCLVGEAPSLDDTAARYRRRYWRRRYI